MRVAILTCIAVALAGDSSTVYGQETILRHRWVKGDEIRYRHSEQSKMTMSDPQRSRERVIDGNTVHVMRLTVLDVRADGSVTLREIFESVRSELNLPTGKIVLDSTSAEKPADSDLSAFAALLFAKIGESTTFVLEPTGEVTRVGSTSRILDRVVGALPPDQPPEITNLISRGVRRQLGSLIAEGFPIFPRRALKAGDTWTREPQQNARLLGTETPLATYTFKGVESRGGTSVARIGVTFSLKPVTDDSFVLEDFKGEGEILFDIGAGRLQRASKTMETSIKFSDGQAEVQGVARSSVLMEVVGQ